MRTFSQAFFMIQLLLLLLHDPITSCIAFNQIAKVQSQCRMLELCTALCGCNGIIITVEPQYNEGPRLFFMYFTITRVKKIVFYTEDFVV